MKNLFFFILFYLLATFTQAQTIAITPSSLEVIDASAVTQAFYDLDDVYLKYKTGTLTVYEAATGNQLFSGDTSETTITGASHWGAKAAKLTTWYQHVTKTDGYRYWIPKRGCRSSIKPAIPASNSSTGSPKKLMLSATLDTMKMKNQFTS